ncbi:MAG: S1C family serine protease [Opitutales bacterium]
MVKFFMFSLIVFLSAGFYLHAVSESKKNWFSQTPNKHEDLIKIQNRLQELLPATKKTLVAIEADDGAGSGVLVSEDGLVLTAAHVIGETGKKMRVRLPNGKSFPAVSLGGSEISDAGMLKITKKGKWPFAPIAQKGVSKFGDWCFAIGHPGGFNKERGIVVRLGRVIGKSEETLQSDSRLLGGDSGGPLFNFNGEVIAIHSRISKESDQNFHVPIESFHINWEFYKKGELLTFDRLQNQAFLGVACEKVAEGLAILNVVENSSAQKIGMRKGDILLSFNNEKLDSREELTILVSSKIPGDKVKIQYQRDDTQLSVEVILGDRPKE